MANASVRELKIRDMVVTTGLVGIKLFHFSDKKRKSQRSQPGQYPAKPDLVHICKVGQFEFTL